MKKYISTTLLALTTFIASIALFSSTAFATEVDATNEVAKEKAVHRWFFWPSWAFLALLITILALMSFFYYKNVLSHKRRGGQAS